MAGLINVSLDLSKIDKTKVKDGKYLNAIVAIGDDTNQYGQNASMYISQSKEEREALNSVKTSVSTWWDKFKSTGDSVFKNEKWKETEGQKQKGLEILWKQFEKMYKDDPKNAKYIAAFIETSSANSSHIMRMAGYPIGYEVNWKDTLSYRGPEREHVIPANQIGEFLFKVATGRFGNKITIDKVMPFINDNYFQSLYNFF